MPPPPSLAGLLGPTTLSGFVDVYYGQNFNNPAGQANGLRFFDGGTNQFGLNLVELVVDKAPEVTNSRTGYHVALGFGQAMNAVNGSDHGGLGFDQLMGTQGIRGFWRESNDPQHPYVAWTARVRVGTSIALAPTR